MGILKETNNLSAVIGNVFAPGSGALVKAAYPFQVARNIPMILLLCMCLSWLVLSYSTPPSDIGQWGYTGNGSENIRPDYSVEDIWAGSSPVWNLDNVHYWSDGVFGFMGQATGFFTALGFLQERIPSNFFAVASLNFDKLDFSVPVIITQPWSFICQLVVLFVFGVTVLPVALYGFYFSFGSIFKPITGLPLSPLLPL